MDVDETGTATQGVKLSMFDNFEPGKMWMRCRNIYWRTAILRMFPYNYKAAFINTDKNLIGFSAYGQTQNYYLFSLMTKKGSSRKYLKEK